VVGGLSAEPIGFDMILIPHSPEAGLFSQINFLITYIDTLGHAEFFVDWSGGILYSTGDGTNVFEELFVQNRVRDEESEIVQEWPHHRYTGPGADPLYLSGNWWRARLHDCWEQLTVRKELLDEVEAYCVTWKERPAALHVRNSKIGAECPQGRAPSLEDYAAVVRGIRGPIFLATDNSETLEFFRELLGDRLLSREVGRSGDMKTEYHLSERQSIRDAQNCLLDALIMSRCSQLIHSVSNIATAVLSINPTLDHIYVRHDGALRLPAGKSEARYRLVRQTLKEESPVSVLHVEHPHWNDWIQVFENGVFKRNLSGEAGTLKRCKNGELELDWLDWDKERFFPLERQDDRCHSRPFRYRLSKTSRVVVNLKHGLGNQMFQYAFGVAVARARGCELAAVHQGWGPPFALGAFGISPTRSLVERDFDLSWEESYEEGMEDEMLSDAIDSGVGTLWVEGYFQNEAFFLSVADEIRRLFLIPVELPEECKGRTPIAVHVRLGDYLSSETHAPLPPSYYREALTLMRERFDDPVFFLSFPMSLKK